MQTPTPRIHRRGQASTEAVLIISLCAIALLLVTTVFGNDIKDAFFGSSDSLRGGQAENIGFEQESHARSDTKHDTGRLGGAAPQGTGGAGDGQASASREGPGAGRLPTLSEPTEPGWRERLLRGGLTALLGQPLEGESTYVELEGELGLGASSFAGGLDGKVRLQQNGDGTIELTYGGGGRLELNAALGKAKIGITAGGKQYGLGAEVSAGAGGMGGGEVTLQFDPNKQGDMELLLDALTGNWTAAPELLGHVSRVESTAGAYGELAGHVTAGLEWGKIDIGAEQTRSVEYARNQDGRWSRSESVTVALDGSYTHPWPEGNEITRGERYGTSVEFTMVTDDDIASLQDVMRAGDPRGPPKSLQITLETDYLEDGWLYSKGRKERATITVDSPETIAALKTEIDDYTRMPSGKNLNKLMEQMQQKGAKLSRETEDTRTGGLGVAGGIGILSQSIGAKVGLSGTRGTIQQNR